MPKLTRIYTKSGDDGTTGLGGGQRVPKHSPRIEAYGTVDELNSQIGVALASGLDPELAATLRTVQNELFHLGAELSVPDDEQAGAVGPRMESRHVKSLEAMMDRLSEELAPLENFVLPGGSPAAAHLHLARAVCRRAEREVVALARREAVGPWVGRYLNRLSDALFVLARSENRKRGCGDVLWNSRA